MMSVKVQSGYSEKLRGVIKRNPWDHPGEAVGVTSTLGIHSRHPVVGLGQLLAGRPSTRQKSQMQTEDSEDRLELLGPICVCLVKVKDLQRGMTTPERN